MKYLILLTLVSLLQAIPAHAQSRRKTTAEIFAPVDDDPDGTVAWSEHVNAHLQAGTNAALKQLDDDFNQRQVQRQIEDLNSQVEKLKRETDGY